MRPLADIEKDYILAALQLNRGNQTAYAPSSCASATATLYRKLKRYGLVGGSGPSRHPAARVTSTSLPRTGA